MYGRASDTKNIPFMAYGTHQAGGRGEIPISQCLVFEGQQMREGENYAYEIVDGNYDPIPN